MTTPTLLVFVPPNHPMHGQTIELPAASGATTYTEGTIRFTSTEHETLVVELQQLREALGALAAPEKRTR